MEIMDYAYIIIFLSLIAGALVKAAWDEWNKLK